MTEKAGRFYRDADGCIAVTYWSEDGSQLRIVYVWCPDADRSDHGCVGEDYGTSDWQNYTPVRPTDWEDVKPPVPTFEFGDHVLVRFFASQAWVPGRYVMKGGDGVSSLHSVHVPGRTVSVNTFTDDNIKPAN